MSVQKRPEYLFKILVIGEMGCGKTSIIRRYVHNMFSDNYKATIGVDFALKVVQGSFSQSDNPSDPVRTVRMQLWDIAGQERFGQMTRVYYKDAVGALVVFDLSRRDTFEAVKKWKSDLDKKVLLKDDGSPIPCVLVANKSDIPKENHCVSEDEMDAEMIQSEFACRVSTSAKTGDNLGFAVDSLLKEIFKRKDEAAKKSPSSDGGIPSSQASSSSPEDAPLQLGPYQPGEKKKKGCC